MTTHQIFSCLCALALSAPLIGCGDDSGNGNGGTAGDGGASGTGGSAGTGGAAGTGGRPGFQTYGLLLSGVDPGGPHPLEGVQMCEADTDNCATSNAIGYAEIELPVNQEVTITLEKDGYASFVVGDVSDDTYERLTSRRLYTNQQMEAIATELGVAYPWTGGIVGLVRFPDEHADVSFIPVGSTMTEVGESFYYDAATEQYSLELTATTSIAQSWLLALGQGGYTDVTPGEQQFEFSEAAGTCRPSWAWPGDAPNTIRVPVREGFRTYGSMVCQ